jgi:hypothetical protein
MAGLPRFKKGILQGKKRRARNFQVFLSVDRDLKLFAAS